jgi:TRAP-type C4-dicarboxylate transport system substrate-binding protein
MAKKVLGFGLILLLVLAVAAACGGGGDAPKTAPAPAKPAAPAAAPAPAAPAPAAPAPAAPVAPIKWKLIAPWDKLNDTVKNVTIPFAEDITKRSGGRLTVEVVGPEAVPAFEQLRPVKDGIFQMAYTHPAYHSEFTPLGNAMDLISAPERAWNECGVLTLMDDVYQKKAGVHYAGKVSPGFGARMFLKKEINTADLAGLKIRGAPVYHPVIKLLGGVPVTMAFPDIYPGLEKGIIDGLIWGGGGAYGAKWYEVAKYGYRPMLGESHSMVLVNNDAWSKLPKDLQTVVLDAIAETNKRAPGVMKPIDDAEWASLARVGMKIIDLPAPEGARLLKSYYDSSMEDHLKKDTEFGPRMKTALDCVQSKPKS